MEKVNEAADNLVAAFMSGYSEGYVTDDALASMKDILEGVEPELRLDVLIKFSDTLSNSGVDCPVPKGLFIDENSSN